MNIFIMRGKFGFWFSIVIIVAASVAIVLVVWG